MIDWCSIATTSRIQCYGELNRNIRQCLEAPTRQTMVATSLACTYDAFGCTREVVFPRCCAHDSIAFGEFKPETNFTNTPPRSSAVKITPSRERPSYSKKYLQMFSAFKLILWPFESNINLTFAAKYTEKVKVACSVCLFQVHELHAASNGFYGS